MSTSGQSKYMSIPFIFYFCRHHDCPLRISFRPKYTTPPTVAPMGEEGDADRSLPQLRLQK